MAIWCCNETESPSPAGTSEGSGQPRQPQVRLLLSSLLILESRCSYRLAAACLRTR